ncbi:MAG: protein jag [Clostridiales bacterium]|jgi:spoIIIJ-associated protein|nr:protein jag [Clostridiales bacterium]
MDFSEKWGRDIDEAVDLALKDLNVTRDQVKVIVLEEPSKGFFGIGSKLAKVRVEKIIEEKEEKEVRFEDEDRKKVEFAHKRQRRKQKSVKTKKKTQHKSHITVSQKPEDLEEINDTPALDFLRDITGKMGLELDIKAYANDDCLYLEMYGKDSGTIIGKRGQTLDSIQYLTSLVVNKDSNKYTRVIVDAENYRAKREKTLEQLAWRLADKVEKTGKNVRLEPMNPYERKVIHSTLQKSKTVTTRSEGEEPYRRVIIEQNK